MKARSKRGRAFQYKAVNSPVHRLSAGWKILLIVVLATVALAMGDPLMLIPLAAVNLVYYFSARLQLMDLWRDVRLFLIQMAIIVALYSIRYGFTEGVGPGLFIGFKILLFFMPTAVFLRTTPTTDIMGSLQKIMSRRTAFFIFTSFRFIPYFIREFSDIAKAQRLRGARVAPRDLVDPRSWPDLFHCLLVPVVVRAFVAAEEAALSAQSRSFEGIHRKQKDSGEDH